ncbi:MAG: hypothetical protein L3J78_00345 [Thermoplasmata archaeon]|nr:hypothetical protein [Thermoplasmata archaeon]
MKRFHGTTIYHKAGNCAYVVRKEVEGRRAWAAAIAKAKEARRQARREAVRRPIRAFIGLFRRRPPT